MALKFEFPEQVGHLKSDVIADICKNPGFGNYFTDHMAVADWTAESGWHNDRLIDYNSIAMEPAGAVFHYAQEVFEGLKAYRHADNSVWLFRPDANGRRLANSARRLALPELPVEDFVTSVKQLTALDSCWVPSAEEQSLYLRPFMIAAENYLGVRAAESVLYSVIASPVGAYFSGGVKPVDIWISKEYSRVATGGTGEAKCGGNYAASLLPQRIAYQQGCAQVLFVDAAEHKYIEELGGMNFCVVTDDDKLITPELNGNILPGITRDSLVQIAPKLGLEPLGQPLELAEVLSGIKDGTIREVFACGTAAVITPIGTLKDGDEVYHLPAASETKNYTMALRNYLLDLQYGRIEDEFGWMVKVC